ncbi:MAG: fibronectin type III domain-containing protein [Methanomassiliicoccales archaeon]
MALIPALILLILMTQALASGTASAAAVTPINVTVVAGDGSLQISWSLNGTSLSAIKESWVYIGRTNDSLMLNRTIQGSLICTINGLVNGADYFIAVRIVKDGEVGPYSEIVKATPRTVPNAPINLEAIRGDRFLNITWMPPTFNGGANITRYRIYEVSTGSPIFIAEVINQTWFVHSDLIAYKSYYYQVSAVNPAGEGERSITLKVLPDIPPGSPRDLNGTPGVREIELTWIRSLENGGSPLKGYIILRGDSAANLTLLVSMGVIESYTDKGLPDNATYYYAVIALNDAGESEPCLAISAHTLDVPHPHLLTVVEGSHSATLIWTSEPAPGAPTLRHWIMRWVNASDVVVVAVVQGSGVYLDSGLADGVNYTYWIEAENIVGRGTSRHINVYPRSVPNAPENLTAMPSEIYTILLWSPPYDGGAPVLGYEVRLRQGSSYIERLVDCGPNLNYQASGLIVGREYIINVRAYNEAGVGNWSQDLVLVSGDLPGLVQNLAGTPGDMSATLTWTRPAKIGSPGNFSYFVVRTLLNGTSRTTFNVSNPSLIDTGLVNKVAYRYYVYAKNDVGLSNGSVGIYVVPKKPGPELQAPTNLRVENNSFSVKLTWNAPPSDFTLLGFRIFRSLNETGVMSFLATTNRTDYTDTTVVTGLDYDYYVRAYNMVEEGQLSTSVTAHAKGETQDWFAMILSFLPYVLAMVVVIVLIIFVLGRKGKGKRKKPARAKKPVPKK